MASESTWVLLHGTPLSPSVWDGVRPFLERTGPVLTPALPRPGGGEACAQTDIARRTLAAIDEAAAPLRIVGHSFGGQIALELALAAPERVASLTVLCSRATAFPAFAQAAKALRRDGTVDVDGSLSRWFTPGELAAGGAVIDYARDCLIHADRKAWAEDLEAIAAYDRLAALSAIAVPTMVIAAEHDRVGTPEQMRAMATNISGSTFVCVADASHMSQFLDPERLALRLIGTPLPGSDR